MGYRKIAFLIIATLACDSAALAGGGGRGTSGGSVASVAHPNRSSKNGARDFFIVRTPLPIGRAPASIGTVGSGAPGRIDSRIDSRF
jgi:hypothetical protein